MLSLQKYLLVVLFSSSAFSFSQNPDIKRTYNWYFGNHAGINFSSGSPTALTNSSMNVWESSAVISDTAGNLLFYTDGDTVWNLNHQPMPNGTGLMGCGIDTSGGNFYNNSSTQGALIIPKPGSDSIYYIFTTDCIENNGANGLRYSEVNMKLNGGLGDITSNKNILLHAPITEKLTATYHSNGTDIWILTHEDSTTNFLSFLVSSTGVNPAPMISNIGTLITTSTSLGGATGWLRVSYDGKKVAAAYTSTLTTASLELFDFDNNTGIISNNMVLLKDTSAYGLCFSPDNSKLYVHTMGSMSSSKISQFDLCAGDINAIKASRKFLAMNTWGAMQLGSDGKIYVATGWLDSLGVINNPDSLFPACNYAPVGFYLGGGKSDEGMCNFVESYLNVTASKLCLTTITENINLDVITIFPNPTTGSIYIDFQNFSNTTLRVYTLLGETVFNENVIGKKNIALNLSAQQDGIYLINIHTEKTSITRKIILTK